MNLHGKDSLVNKEVGRKIESMVEKKLSYNKIRTIPETESKTSFFCQQLCTQLPRTILKNHLMTRFITTFDLLCPVVKWARGQKILTE